jgi:tRNA A37 methylthiotransferase MiaB
MGYDIIHGREIADTFRRQGKVVIFGGYQAHFSQGNLNNVVDCIVYGHPGPTTMARILEDVQAGCLMPEYDVGIDLNFPFDYSILLKRRIAFMPILASVGCRNRCDFCCTAARHRGEYRLRKLRYVLSDLQAIQNHTHRFGLVDANIYNNREYLIALCSAIKSTGTKFQWGAEATIGIGEDDEALSALRSAGCRMLYIGFETLNQNNLNSVHKPYKSATYERAMKRIQQYGFVVAGYFIVGLDGDTTETFDELFEFIHRTRINLPVINILLPAPGTNVFERLDREGRLLVNTEEEYLKNALFYSSSSCRCFFRPVGLTAKELEKGLINLRQRLASLREIVRRSLVRDPINATFLLSMNVQFHHDSRRIAAAWKATQVDNFALTSDVNITDGTLD